MFRRNPAKMVLLASLLLTTAQAQAQAQDEVALVRDLTVHVRPGMEAQFEEVVRAYREASREQGLENYWLSAQAVSGRPGYIFRFPMSSWADLSEPEPELSETFGDREANRLMGLLSDSVEASHTAFYRQLASLSHPPPNMDETPEALIYIDFTLAPNGGPQYQEMSTRTAEAFRAVRPDYYFFTALPDLGASGPRTILWTPSMSDLDSPAGPPGEAVLEHFGPEEGARINAMSESLESFTYSLYRTRPDLNYQPDQ